MERKKYKLITVSVILLFLIIVLIVAYIDFQKKDFRRLRSTGWIKMSDKYESDGVVDFPGIPIQMNSIIFYEDTAKICWIADSNKSEEDLEEDIDVVDLYSNNEVCVDYDYEWKKGKLFIDKNPKDKDGIIEYTYMFNKDGGLVIKYNGEGFEYKIYYAGALG